MMMMMINPFLGHNSGDAPAQPTYRYFRWDFTGSNGVNAVGANAFSLASSIGGTNVVPGKTASASSIDSGTYPAIKALNDADGEWWLSAAGFPQWWKVDLGVGNAITPAEYKIMPPGGGFGAWSPKDWTLSVSNDDITYILIDTRSNITSWTAAVYNSYTLAYSAQILGLAVTGTTATCAITPTPTSATYVWKKNGTSTGDIGATRVFVAGDIGATITCDGTAVGPIGSGSYSSNSVTPASTAARASSIVYVNNASSKVFSFPSGSLAGDTCVIIAGHGWNVVTPTGWTTIDTSSGTNFNGAAFLKTLTAADITAGSVTISFAGTYYGVVAGFTFAGAPTSKRTHTFTRNSSGSTSRTSTTGSSPVSGDIAIYFGGGRGNNTVTTSVGTSLGTTSNSEGSGVLAWRTLGAGGADSVTFTYSSSPTGDYYGIVVFQP